MSTLSAFASCLSQNHIAHLGSASVIDFHLRMLLLLQPKGITIPDSSLFSDAVRESVNHPDSWLLSAMQAGLVKVLTRDPSICSFVQSRDYVASYGFNTAERPEMAVLAKKMEGFSKDVRWESWPTAMGQSMFGLVSKNLLRPTEELAELVQGNRQALKFLNGLPKLQRIVEEVVEDSERAGRPNDLRVSDVVRKLASKYYGRPDVSQIPSLVSSNLANNNAGVAADDVRSFLAIIARLYDINFGANGNMSVERMKYAPWIDLFCRLPAGVESPEPDLEPSGVFYVYLPTMTQISRMPSDALLGLVSKRGPYEAAMENYLSPSSSSAEQESKRQALQDALIEYTTKICEAVPKASSPIQYGAKIGRQYIDDLRDWRMAIAKTPFQFGPGVVKAAIDAGIGVTPLLLLAKSLGGYCSEVVELCPLVGTPVSVGFSMSGRLSARVDR